MKKEFYVLKDSENEYRPMAFITPADEAREIRKDLFRLRKGESIVLVEIVEAN